MFSDILKELRDLNNDTQGTLARKLGIAQSTVSNWEQNKCEPSFEQLSRICDLYGVSADYLLGRRLDDSHLRRRRFDALSPENQRFIIKMENLLLNDQESNMFRQRAQGAKGDSDKQMRK